LPFAIVVADASPFAIVVADASPFAIAIADASPFAIAIAGPAGRPGDQQDGRTQPRGGGRV